MIARSAQCSVLHLCRAIRRATGLTLHAYRDEVRLRLALERLEHGERDPCRIPGDTFGFDAVGMGDVDSDGTADFLITSAWSGIHPFHSGRMFIISSGVHAELKRFQF